MALTFFYDFTSSYSYLAVMRMEETAAEAGVVVEWTPFLLGPIFADAGYATSPNLMAPAKARYMWRDIGRKAARRGLDFQIPETFPQKSVAAGRAALALPPADRPRFSRAVYTELFGRGRNIADIDVLRDAARASGLDPDAIEAATRDPAAKQALFESGDRAKAHGVFGAPSFLTSDGELFWGDDRLDDALAWERSGAQPAGR